MSGPGAFQRCRGICVSLPYTTLYGNSDVRNARNQAVRGSKTPLLPQRGRGASRAQTRSLHTSIFRIRGRPTASMS